MRLSLIVTLLVCTGLEAESSKTQNSTALSHPTKRYALSTWNNDTCRAKGRFQDREYCGSAVMDEIVADGTEAISALISQITDTRMIKRPVYDFWPQIRTGELAYFILANLFVDDTWEKVTMPELFPIQPCDEPSWVCWANFRKRHSLKELQSVWMKFWLANRKNIYWDDKARCFRLRSKSDNELSKTTSSH